MSWLRAIYGFFYEIFFGCSHGNLTRPFTMRSHSYKVCLDCGKQFPYSVEEMRMLHTWELGRQPTHQSELAPISLVPTPAAQDSYASSKAVA